MVDPARAELDLAGRHREVGTELLHGVKHGMTEPDDREGARTKTGEHCCRHRIRIVEDQRARCEALDVGQDVEPHRQCAQRLEQPAGTDRVADALINAVAQRNLVVVTHVGEAGNLDRVDDEVAAGEHARTIGRRGDVPVATDPFREMLANSMGELEPLRVDVDEVDRSAAEIGCAHEVGHQLGRELGAPRADERDDERFHDRAIASPLVSSNTCTSSGSTATRSCVPRCGRSVGGSRNRIMPFPSPSPSAVGAAIRP